MHGTGNRARPPGPSTAIQVGLARHARATAWHSRSRWRAEGLVQLPGLVPPRPKWDMYRPGRTCRAPTRRQAGRHARLAGGGERPAALPGWPGTPQPRLLQPWVTGPGHRRCWHRQRPLFRLQCHRAPHAACAWRLPPSSPASSPAPWPAARPFQRSCPACPGFPASGGQPPACAGEQSERARDGRA